MSERTSETIGFSDDHAGIINTVMRRKQVDRNDMDRSNRELVVHGVGKFYCSYCTGYAWSSRFSWIRIDLYNQRISYRWAMKCIRCHSIEKPDFFVPEFERIVEKAVCLYKGDPLPPYQGSNPFFTEPHVPLLCEKCGWGTGKCWIGRR